MNIRNQLPERKVHLRQLIFVYPNDSIYPNAFMHLNIFHI